MPHDDPADNHEGVAFARRALGGSLDGGMSKRAIVKFGIVTAALAVAAWLVVADVFITPEHLPETMSAAAPQRCVAIFVVCVALWLTNLLPPAATGLLAIALLPLLNVLPEREAFRLFGNEAVFFMLGVFLLAGATIATGLSKRVTLLALQRFDQSPNRLVAGVTLSAAFLSLWMPEHAVAAMIYPIIVEITNTLKLERGSPYAKKLFLALAWGAIIGGVGTFLGGARAPLAISLLKQEHPDQTISFLGWMTAAMPIVVIMSAIAVMMLRVRVANNITDIKAATRMLDERVKRLGPMAPAERRLTALGIITIVLWITVGHAVGVSTIAILSAVMLFALRIVDWRGVQTYVNWGVLVMYGGAVALGFALSETHALAFLVNQAVSPETPRFVILLALVATAMILTEGISNSAAVAILLPIGYSLGTATGLDPITVTLAVTIPAGLTFLLPVSSPPNAISFAAGHYSIREVVQIGWPMTVLAFVTIVSVIVVWWGWALGMKIF